MKGAMLVVVGSIPGRFFLSGGDWRIMVENWYEYLILDERGYVSSCGVNTWKVLSFWRGLQKSHMVENWYEYLILDERGYVSSCGVNTWKVFSFWRGLEKSHMVESWYEYHFR